MSSIQYSLQKSLDKLKQKFPDVGDVTLQINAPDTIFRFSRDWNIRRIEISDNYLAPTKRLYVLAHEFRHAIQFARGWATEKDAFHYYYRNHPFFYNIENDANNWCIKVAPKLFRLNNKQIAIFHEEYKFLQDCCKPDAEKFGLDVDWNFMFNEHFRPTPTINYDLNLNFVE